MAMPRTTVNRNYVAVPWKNDVWAVRRIFAVEANSQPHGMENLADVPQFASPRSPPVPSSRSYLGKHKPTADRPLGPRCPSAGASAPR